MNTFRPTVRADFGRATSLTPSSFRRGRSSPWRWFALMAVSAALLAVLAPAAARAEPLSTVRLAIGYIPNVQFTPLYVGIAKGYYQDEGIDLQIQYGFGIDIFSLLALKKIDLGLSDSDQLIIAGSKGIDLKAIYQYYQSDPVAIIAKKSVASSPQELVGKTIGTPALYGSSYIGLMLFLHHFGLEGKVRVENIGYSQIPALLSGRVAAAVCFITNESVKLRQLGVPISEWDVRDFSNMVGSSFISSGPIIEERGPVLRRFAAATRRAMAFTVDHPEEALRIAKRYLDAADQGEGSFLSASLAATTSLFASPSGYGSIDRSNYEGSIESLARIGLIPQAYPAERIVHPF